MRTAARVCRPVAVIVAGLFAGSCGFSHLAVSGGEGDGIERSVVRIVNYSQRPDWREPWNPAPVRPEVGSGFVVEGGRILTNAHVVSESRLCLFFLNGDPAPREARIVTIGHDCDLALLEPVDAAALRGIGSLPFGGLPPVRSQVETFGFPAGGERLSSTRGVVSRIDLQPYVHSGMDAHLTIQTDAAINPGNSGGPVVAGGRVVGMAFQGNARLDNVGYFIPTEVIRHFLVDAADGAYGGYPELGVLSTASLENTAARARAGLGPGETGVAVATVLPGSSADGLLRRGDVLVDVEEHSVANDGTVVANGLRLHFGVLVDRKQVGEVLRVRVRRQGRPLDVDIPLRDYPPQRRYAYAHDVLPRYFVYAGLVFSPLGRDVVEALGREASPRLLYEFWHRVREEPETLLREPIILLRRLDDPVNARSPWEGNLLVERVNGHPVEGLADLIRRLEENEGAFQVIEYASPGGLTVLDREEAEAASPEILRHYGVARDRRL